MDEDIRALLEGHPATTGDLPVPKVLNVDLLDVAVIGDPMVSAFAPDPSGQGRIRPIGINPNHLDASGLVHESMFLGRRSEPTAILDRHGSCYLSAAASWGSRHS